MNRISIILIFIISLLFSPYLESQEIIDLESRSLVLEDSQLFQGFSNKLFILQDDTAVLTLEDILKPQIQEKFILSKEIAPNYGYTKSAYWVRVEIENHSNYRDWIIDQNFPMIQDLKVYHYENGVLKQNYETGLKFPFSNRPLEHRKLLFPVEINPNQKSTIYFRFQSQSIVIVSLGISEKFDFYQRDTKENFVFGLYYGIIVVMLFYNFFLFIFTRDFSYFIYVLFILATSLFVFSQNGFGYQYFWSNSPYWGIRANNILIGISIIFAFLYSGFFLNIDRTIPSYRWIYYPQVFLAMVIVIAISVLEDYSVYTRILNALALNTLITVQASGFFALKRGYKPALYFSLGFLFILIGGGSAVLRTMKLLPVNFFTLYSMQIGSVLEVVFLSIGLAHRINVLKKQKIYSDTMNQAKSSFLAMMSHEIRTPMNGVLGITELLMKTDLDEEQKEFVEIIHSSGKTLVVILNDILDFSKMEMNRLELEFHEFDVKRCIYEIIALYKRSASEKNIELIADLEPNLPDRIVADPIRFNQILLNLTSNALKFTSEGKIIISARMEAMHTFYPKIHISVSDTGIGISADKIDKLFDSFYQVDSSITRKYGGTGLGLAISSRLVHLMSGRIWLESKLGEGSTFHFTIPTEVLKDDSQSDPKAKKFVNKNTIMMPPGANQYAVKDMKSIDESSNEIDKLNILIAEDNEINQQVLLKFLRSLGYSADLARTGIEVLEKIQIKEYNIILMDIQMPDMDGVDATKRIRLLETIKQPVIIAITANTVLSDIDSYFKYGMDDYLAKPFNSDSLNSLIQKWSKGRNL
ncbi:hybrid sensor histidine kinase/response regulator [Leptospira sp. GIMC2001]|uniref:hybrid sensor histidine kinase/response regulator n=1 Tax=Leptospira sp. GIMC2001 TaxID=1513297 RepID=UPI002348F14A|nr:hybrid sensor histidine kinase/response regulator [Leptospira sp. GIMC2001]WCL49850.1 ATP-binding protein [Leptospira sp. GIMC2001]